jgi:hypothetical protein
VGLTATDPVAGGAGGLVSAELLGFGMGFDTSSRKKRRGQYKKKLK